jgi:magnesium transporter
MLDSRLALIRSFDPQTAGEHLELDVPAVAPETTAGEARTGIIGRRFASAVDVAVLQDGRLAGLIRIEDLLAAEPQRPCGDIMDATPPVVAPGVDQERVAWQAVHQAESSIAVVDTTGNFLGLIPPNRLLEVLLWEHDEDMARLGGYLRDTQAARTASEEQVVRRFLHRMPWLLVGLLGAVLAADIVGSFERNLEENVLLAFFMPGIVYMADAVGTQTEALIIRGLSVGVPIHRVARREIITGLLVGIVLSAVLLPVVLLRWGEGDIAVAVALGLFGACSTATAVAMALPWLLHRSGRDPAFGSGPLATVIQDLLSILIYFGVASLVVT